MICASLMQNNEKRTMVSTVKGESSQSGSCIIKCTETSLKSRLIPLFLR